MAQRKNKRKKNTHRQPKRKESKRAKRRYRKGDKKSMFETAYVICLSILFTVSLSLTLYFLHESKKTHALWCATASIIFAAVGTSCYIQAFVINRSDAYHINRGFVDIIKIDPTPPVFIVGKETAVEISWANPGNSASKIKEGRVYAFISPTRPLENQITCPDSGKSINAGILLRGRPRTDRFWYESKLFTIDAIGAFIRGNAFFGVCGKVRYLTLGEEEVFDFCTYYDPEEQSYVNCKQDKK